ncbi:hypothetical protein KP509_25G068000 [Ceratopteris richardii]|uniref:Uncharacterized protein n=1 Tax=Ceratopteris richardii TaxID=49495 RepID=A0A8T2RST0_CERRI|nr:hypothetical protein KP509_25G068000 [Ceratopteris richardii]
MWSASRRMRRTAILGQILGLQARRQQEEADLGKTQRQNHPPQPQSLPRRKRRCADGAAFFFQQQLTLGQPLRQPAHPVHDLPRLHAPSGHLLIILPLLLLTSASLPLSSPSAHLYGHDLFSVDRHRHGTHLLFSLRIFIPFQCVWCCPDLSTSTAQPTIAHSLSCLLMKSLGHQAAEYYY